MRRTFFILSVYFLLFNGTSCIKDNNECKNKTVQSEQAAINAYATTSGMAGTSHSSGLYYKIVNPGSGTTPTNTSRVSVTYTGKYLDGNEFNSSVTPVTFGLGDGIIEGWRIGLPLIAEGGTIQMVIPSSLAYGCQGRYPIGGNTILFFEVHLVDVL